MTDFNLVENRTSLGATVLLYAHEICNAVGAHGLKIGTDGELEVLIMSPDESGWVALEDAPMVQVGTTRSKPAKKS